MLVMYFCARGIDVADVFVWKVYRFWSCICVLGVSMLVMYFCARVSMSVVYSCARSIDVGHVFVC